MENSDEFSTAFLEECMVLYSLRCREFLVDSRSFLKGDNSPQLLDALRRVILKGEGQLRGGHDRVVYPKHLPFPHIFPPNIRKHHLKNFHRKKSKFENIKWNFVGDSILSVGANIVSPSESPCYTWSDEILKQNHGLNINFHNFAIGGTTWRDLAGDFPPSPWWENSKNVSWLQYVINSAPDVICLWFGGNDGREINVPSMHYIIDYIRNNLPECDIILCVTYLPSFGSTLWTGYGSIPGQQDRMFAQQYTRSYARWKDIGYLDVGRWHTMMRDGYDPCEISLTRVVPCADSNIPAFAETTEWHSDKLFFPDWKNDNNVSASSCTDWSICFGAEHTPNNLTINLSYSDDSFNQPSGNSCLIVLNEDTIKVKISDGGKSKHSIDIDTHISPRRLEMKWFTLTLKDSRLTLSIPHAGFFPDLNANRIGAGYVDVFDMQIPRFGGRYHPFIAGLANIGKLSLYNLCVADSTRADGGCRRYMPSHSDYELYAASESAGGSDDYHMNTYGVRDVIAPVIRNERW